MKECYLCYTNYEESRMHDEFICVYCRQDVDPIELMREIKQFKISNKFTRNLPEGVREKLHKKAGYLCQYCYERPSAHIDHIVPWSFVGKHEIDNLMAVCARCNLWCSSKVFNSLEEKRMFVRKKLLLKRKKQPIPIWIESELKEVSYNLRFGFKIVVKDIEEGLNVMYKLRKEGYNPII